MQGRVLKIVRTLLIQSALLLALGGCGITTGHLGLATLSSSNSTSLLSAGVYYKELGHVTGVACRFIHMPHLFPQQGRNDFAAAVEDALAKRRGDALIHITIRTQHPSFWKWQLDYILMALRMGFPGFICTEVKGLAIKFLAAPRGKRR